MDGVGSDYATLGIVDSGGLYKPVELECEGGMTVGMEAPTICPRVKGKKGNLAKIVRRSLSDRLREGDAPEMAGYPERWDRRIVRTVRDGRVVATVAFMTGLGVDWKTLAATALDSKTAVPGGSPDFVLRRALLPRRRRSPPRRRGARPPVAPVPMP